MIKIIVFFGVLLIIFSGCETIVPYHTEELKYIEADGTAPRIEREFKYFIEGEVGEEFAVEDLAKDIEMYLAKVEQQEWTAPKMMDNFYFTDDEAESFVYFDIYFDTEDKLNYQNAVSYRLRQRFKDIDEFVEYVEGEDRENTPYRIEFQAKVNRQDLGDGFSTVEESRFEFREESAPFSFENPPPAKPWDLEEFIGYFQSGRFENYYLWPAKAVVDYLIPEKTEKLELAFYPELVLVTERLRQHLNISTPWGSGPNPEQAFIISLDSVLVYDAEEFLSYLRIGERGVKFSTPELLGNFFEVEVEFERNVSKVLDEEIQSGANLGEVKDAFLKDQEKIMELIKEVFKNNGYDLIPANKSKYITAYEFKK